MIKADNEYEELALEFFLKKYGINTNSITVVLKRKPGFKEADGLTIPAAKDKFVIFIKENHPPADLLRVIAHEAAHVAQIVSGDLSFHKTADGTEVRWLDKVVDPDKIRYKARPWEIQAFAMEKKYIHDFVYKYGNNIQERLIQKDGEWVLVSIKDPNKVLKKFGKSKPSQEEVDKEEARIQRFKHMNEDKIKDLNEFLGEAKTTDDYLTAVNSDLEKKFKKAFGSNLRDIMITHGSTNETYISCKVANATFVSVKSAIDSLKTQKVLFSDENNTEYSCSFANANANVITIDFWIER